MGATFHPLVRIASHRAALSRALACALALVCSSLPSAVSAAPPPGAGTPTVLQGRDGWLFLPSEIRFLQTPSFWGAAAPTASRSAAGENADPLKAILHFRDQLQAEGIQLLLVPVPPKALALKTLLPPETASGLQTDSLPRFFEELRKVQVNFIDLTPVLAQANPPGNEPLYCKGDSHWSGAGCAAAAKAIAGALRPTLESLPKTKFLHKQTSAPILGDLAELASPKNPAQETLSLRQISSESGSALQPDPSSPVLLMGDSHTLVFHDFLAERSGLLDQLAFETGVVPDLIGTRGSGSNAVRVSLLRRSIKDPKYLASKKVVIWCFAAREFTEADQGWQSIPVKK